MRTSAISVRIFLATALVATLFAGVTGTTAQAAADFSVTGSVRQVHVTGARPGATLVLRDAEGTRVATTTVNRLGGAIFYDVKPGDGYRVRQQGGPTSGPVTVRTAAAKPWDPSVYDQSMPDHGYGYMTMRDGTKLAYYVRPPTAPAGQGAPEFPGPPYPTLIEYSGYGYANPDGPNSGIAVLANLMGFTVVNVNMRGTGCSGGAYNFFEPLQNLDGYDIVETVARQPWVKGGKVGMMGISYGGISQLFTAQLRPPSLAAISPLSVIDATATTLYPGGVRNDGFAVNWAKERQNEARPAGPKDHQGQRWAWKRIQEGDEVCKANQVLHPEAEDLMQKIRENRTYRPRVADPLDPVTFVHKINVPVFMACQWQDEQTGGHCPTLAERFTGTDKKWFTFTNGPHIDALHPETYQRWIDFLSIYVANDPPAAHAVPSQAASPIIYQGAMGLPEDKVITLPPDPIQAYPTYETAKAAFEQLPSVRVLFENGAGEGPLRQGEPGDPYAAFEASFAKWPVPETKARRWFFRPDGTMRGKPARRRHVDRFTADPAALPLTNYGDNTGGGGLWGNASQWDWRWKQNPRGTALSYLTPPLKSTRTVVGAGAVYAWVKSSTPDVDLQATVTEVRPDGNEVFVQNGYLRGSMRKLSRDTNNVMKTPSTLLEPQPSMLARDVKPLPEDRFARVAIPLYYQGHAYRKGSRIRVTIAAPNGQQPIWSFSHTKPKRGDTSRVGVLFSPKKRSFLALPVVPGVDVPSDYPPCPSLRNQPCRTYRPTANRARASQATSVSTESAQAAGGDGGSDAVATMAEGGSSDAPTLPATGSAAALPGLGLLAGGMGFALRRRLRP
ncbi:MAG TPA: CocE/NonD family hydrolase [Egibacteraceae bacterium]|nr:CocE/NonD family hydrolase [Egibacteraceae bacterium]